MLQFKQSESTAVRRQWMFQLIGANVTNETPTGTKNGVNLAFTTAYLPDPNTFVLTVNGQTLAAAGVDFTLSGQAITMNVAPLATDVFIAAYQVPSLTGQTGKGYISKNGATAVQTTNSMVEIDATNMPGFYYIALTAGELDTLGFIGLRVKTAQSLNYEDKALVSYNDPYVSQGGFVAPPNSTGSGITKTQADDLLKKIKKMIAEEFARFEEEEDAEEIVEQKDYTEKLDAILTAVREIEFPEIPETDLVPVLEAIGSVPKPLDYAPHFKDIGGKVDKIIPLVSENAKAFDGKMNIATDSINSSLKTVKELSVGFAEINKLMETFKSTLSEQSDMDKRFDAMTSGKNDKAIQELSQKFLELQKMMINHKYDILKALNKPTK